MPALQAKMISPRLMRAFADAHETVTFIEVGANDGVHFDPLRPYIAERDWHGVLVEPIPHVFEQLASLYRDDPRITLENVAIAGEEGTRTMHHVAADADPAGLPTWRHLLASFDREHVVRSLGEGPGIDAQVVSTTVECITLESLCRRNGLDAVDLIMIDAEGADGEIVETIDPDAIRPRLLVFEHEHLEPAQAERCHRKLERAGYLLVADGLDTWALDLAPDDALSSTWRTITAELDG